MSGGFYTSLGILSGLNSRLFIVRFVFIDGQTTEPSFSNLFVKFSRNLLDGYVAISIFIVYFANF